MCSPSTTTNCLGLFIRFGQAVARMQVGMNSVFMRRFLHSSIGRIHPGRVPRPRRVRHSNNRAYSNPPRPASTVTDTVSIMAAGGSAGYPGYAGYGWPTGYDGYTGRDGYAPSFNPLQQNQPQPAYGLPLGQPNAILPHTSLVQPPLTSDAMTQNSHPPPTLRQVRSQPQSPKATQHRDTITQPSPESGGVPNPTQRYLEVASHPPFLLPQPRNILVVVDLNGTLLHRPSRHSPTRFVERPYARSFLSYCVNTFTVVVWSSARSQNVSNMCKQLLTPEDSAKVVAVWSRDNFGLSKNDFNQRVQCYKRLTALWNDPVVAASHPMAASGQKWSQLNTVLVDDSIEKARSEPFNLVQIPEFHGNAKEPGFVLPQVHDYLNECSQQANVSAYMKGQPFKIKPEFAL
ncbi:HAD-like domain-containing protein [Xylaria longipes]|nr:HAD-like domain-containing protein [Xylaria longipes]